MEPKQKALKIIEFALDAMEELRHLAPDGTNSLNTHSKKLAFPSINMEEFNNVLRKIASEGVANFKKRHGNSASGWGSDPLEIIDIDWGKFEKYKATVKRDLKNTQFVNKEKTDKDVNPYEEKTDEIKTAQVFNVKDSQFHYGSGDNFQQDRNKKTEPGLLSKYWWKFLIPIAIIVIAFLITQGRTPVLFDSVVFSEKISDNNGIATSTINVATILSRKDDFATSLEKQDFLKTYEDSEVFGKGSFYDIDKGGLIYYVFLFVGKDLVGCSFDTDINIDVEKKLLLLKKGDDVLFRGIFTGSILSGGGWFIEDCYLLD